MNTKNPPQRPSTNRRTFIRLEFERNYIDVPFDQELQDFFAQVEPNTAKSEDIGVMFNYFQLYWPFNTRYVNKKAVNYPQLYRSYRIIEGRRG